MTRRASDRSASGRMCADESEQAIMGKAKTRIMISQSDDPWFNLATEEWIFRDMDPNVQTLFLWRNHDTVVIGRNQNPWSECNLQKMESDGVRLARRTTGGGAVFHDLGNTNFTFLSPRAGYDRAANLGIVIRALSRFGIAAQASGRNDLVVPGGDGPRKVSGSAFRETRDRSFHHGTLLIDADLSRLANYLTPNPKKLQSKGRASVRSRVANLAETFPGLKHDLVVEAIVAEFSEHYGLVGAPIIELLDPQHLRTMDHLRETFERFASWDWRFGRAPRFEHHMSEYFAWGSVEVFADAEAGRIERAQVFSDALDPDMIDAFAKALIGRAYGRAGIEEAIVRTLEHHPDRSAEIMELGAWLKNQVEVE